MILSVIIVVLLAAIAYVHYVQGLFAATVSAACAAIAAFMAFSYHETIVARFTGGAMAAYAGPVVLCGMFALIYLVLRVVIDNFFPGNVRYPVAMDRIGAAVMGIVAAFFATAILAIAAQELPFGPRVAGYSTYPTEDEEIRVDRELAPAYAVESGEGTMYYDLVTVARLDTEEAQQERQSLWLPVDEWFLGLVGSLSDQGALAGNDIESVYPDFKTAMFAQRLGIQRAAEQVALNIADRQDVTVPEVFRVNTEGEYAQFPEGLMQTQGDLGNRAPDKWLKPGNGKTLLVIRAQFSSDAAGSGGFIRFSPGTARLVAGGRQYFPIATLESGTVAVHHRPDDYLMAASGADLIYEVDSATAIDEGKMVDGAFFEFKRYARVDLGGQRIYNVVTKSPMTHVERKLPVQEFIAARLLDTGIGGRRERAAYDQLRESVPDEPADPDAAERTFTGQEPPAIDPDASTGDEEPADPDPDADAGTAEGGSPMDTIRRGADRNNQLLGGDDPE